MDFFFIFFFVAFEAFIAMNSEFFCFVAFEAYIAIDSEIFYSFNALLTSVSLIKRSRFISRGIYRIRYFKKSCYPF